MQINTIPEVNLIIIKQIIFHQLMKNTIIKIINDFIQAKDLFLTVLTNQILLNHEETRQPKNNPTSYKNNFQQQNPVNTQSYQLNA